jgi:putative SOS response-associated peptidase YedK
MAFFADIRTRWTSVRKVKASEATNDLYGFLTTKPSNEIGAIHPKAMPVILTTAEEIEIWMTCPSTGGSESATAVAGGRTAHRRPW